MAIFNFNIHAANANDLKQLLSELKLSPWLRAHSSIRKTTLPFKDGNPDRKTKVETVWMGALTRRPATMQDQIEPMIQMTAPDSGSTFVPGAAVQAQDRSQRKIVTPKITMVWPTLRDPGRRDRMGMTLSPAEETTVAKAPAETLHFNGAVRISLIQSGHGPEAEVRAGYGSNVFTAMELEKEAQALLAVAKQLRQASDAHTRKQRGGFYK